MSSVTIRRGLPADAAVLADLAARTFRETFGADNRPEDMVLHLAEAYGPAQQGRELADPGITTLLAQVEGRLAGYAQLRCGPVPPVITGASPIELAGVPGRH